MKKIISAVCVFALLLSVCSVHAATELTNISIDGWGASNSTMALTKATVDGSEVTVLKWYYKGGSGSTMSVKVGKLEAGKYRLSFWCISPSNPGSGGYGLTNDSKGGFPANSASKNSADWMPQYKTAFQQFSKTVEVLGTQTDVVQYLNFKTEYGETSWLSLYDVRVQKLDENGEAGENLISLKSWDDIYSEPPADVTNAEVQPLDSAALISWVNPSDSDLSQINIYTVENGVKTLAKAVYSPEKSMPASATADGLENGTVYTFLICAADTAGNESQGVSVSVSPVIDAFYAGSISAFKLVGETAEKINQLQTGKIQLTSSLQNNTVSDGKTAVLFAAVYDADGRLTDVSSCEKTVDAGKSEDFLVTVSVPSFDSKLCGYMIDGIKTLNLLCEILEY